MNKELIKKYKPEFDHWLNEGNILYKRNLSNAWYNEDPWDHSSNYITAIIINDEYSEFRKALAEGKTVQLNGTAVNGGYGETWNDCNKENLFIYEINTYRIKSDEPKFKVCDFVRYVHLTSARALEIDNINGNRYYFTNSEMSCLEHELEPWTPVKGEWCWFYDKATSRHSHLAKFNEMWKNKFRSTIDTPWQFCEPFLNSLPSYLKDK